MSMLESEQDTRRNSASQSDRPGQQRQGEERSINAQGFAAHDDFRPADRRPGLAILEYEEGESI